MDSRLLACFSQRVKKAILNIPAPLLDQIEEIRIRINQPIEVVFGNQSYFLSENGHLQKDPDGFLATLDDGEKILNLISRHSLYALEEELKRGYITILGGHRVGIAGKVVVEGNGVELIKHIRFFNFRVARPLPGVSERLLPYVLEQCQPLNTMIISPPRCGKTTLLRDLIRLLSTGKRGSFPGCRVGVVDERSEIAGCLDGLPQYDLGPRTDVLDACPKAEGMMMLIRSMSPQVIACDEIGSKADAEAILEALHAGVKVIVTAHGSNVDDIRHRPGLRPLFDSSIFERFVVLSHREGAGTIEEILNKNEQPVMGYISRRMSHA
jgi:stage III sporulation protein AA